MHLTWNDVLNNPDLIGGDIESQECGNVYRGPLKKISREGNLIVFESEWMARMEEGTDTWKKWDITKLKVDSKCILPRDIGGGRVSFQVAFPDIVVIFPKGGSKLDPAAVEELELKS